MHFKKTALLKNQEGVVDRTLKKNRLILYDALNKHFINCISFYHKLSTLVGLHV